MSHDFPRSFRFEEAQVLGREALSAFNDTISIYCLRKYRSITLPSIASLAVVLVTMQIQLPSNDSAEISASAAIRQTLSRDRSAFASGAGARLPADGLVERARTYMAAGDTDRAIADYDEAIKIDPKATDIWLARGEAYEAKNNLDQAIASYTNAIKLNPKAANLYLARGKAYESKNDFDLAIADYSEAVQLDPKATNVYIFRGNALEAKADLSQAILDYDNAIRLDPTDTAALVARGKARRERGDLDGAIEDYNWAIKISPTASALSGRALTYLAKGERDKAIADFVSAANLQN